MLKRAASIQTSQGELRVVTTSGAPAVGMTYEDECELIDHVQGLAWLFATQILNCYDYGEAHVGIGDNQAAALVTLRGVEFATTIVFDLAVDFNPTQSRLFRLLEERLQLHEHVCEYLTKEEPPPPKVDHGPGGLIIITNVHDQDPEVVAGWVAAEHAMFGHAHDVTSPGNDEGQGQVSRSFFYDGAGGGYQSMHFRTGSHGDDGRSETGGWARL